MQIQSIKIITNPKKPWARELSKKLKIHLIKSGYSVVQKHADVTICIGGDGTILYANFKNRIQGAIIGIGSQSSVVCQFRSDNWEEKILGVLQSANTENRLTLLCEINNRKITAINDVVIHSKDYRVIRISMKLNNVYETFEGDGVIVSTPTGSGAYAYSAGGSLLITSSTSFEVVPICAYKRTIQAQVVEESTVVKIATDRDCSLIVDGILVSKVKPGDTISVKKGKDVRFIDRGVQT